jgi:hypothetical protein
MIFQNIPNFLPVGGFNPAEKYASLGILNMVEHLKKGLLIVGSVGS